MAADELLTLSHNIRFLRQISRYSKRKMAEICGISPKTLTTIESGVFPPRLSVNVVFFLSCHFHLRPSQFFHPLDRTLS